ncbi:amidase signature domain-containing protein [Kalaharituber pfeilii]|nr:amidase signature domain-containing protein [Kalaharituber pfeilii]
MGSPSDKPWCAIAEARGKEIDDAIPAEYRFRKVPEQTDPRNVIDVPEACGILTQRELEITNSPNASKLLEDIRNRVYSAVEVTVAFCKRAAIAHQLTNCVAEVLFEAAIARAKELDAYLAETGQTVGPLHGLPISVKEHIHLNGTRSTCAFTAWADHRFHKDALIVEIFRKAGAVFHVKTTNPQSLLCLETDSNLFGRTLNPYNLNLSCGGSSGGEGALIAMRGSLMGIGTDIGGSIRGAAGFCGIYGFKPSVARMPHGGLSGPQKGMDNIVGVVGPMARHVDDLELFCKVALEYQPWLYEPSLINKSWDHTVTAGPDKLLTIGLMLNDGFVDPHPPIVRCLQETATALKAAGHKVVPWTPISHKEMNELIMNLYFLDGGNGYRDIIKQGNEEATHLVNWVLESFEWKNLTASDTWKLNIKRNKYRTDYAHHWNRSNVDVILCPLAPCAASLHDTSKYFGYTSAWNLLDYSTITFPVGRVQDRDGAVPPPKDDLGNGEWSQAAVNQFFRKLWFEKDENGEVRGPERYRFAPVALQLVGRRYEEEKLVGIMRKVLEARKNAGLGEY